MACTIELHVNDPGISITIDEEGNAADDGMFLSSIKT